MPPMTKLAPAETNARTASRCPCSAAQWRGMLSVWSREPSGSSSSSASLSSRPDSSSFSLSAHVASSRHFKIIFKISPCPVLAATCMTDSFLIVRESQFAPRFSSVRTTSS